MSKIQLPLLISPNMKLSQYDTEHGKGMNDAVLLSERKYILPNGKESIFLVFTRVPPDQLKLSSIEQRQDQTSLIRNLIGTRLKSLKATKIQKDIVQNGINRMDENNTSSSDKNHVSADGFNGLINNKKFSSLIPNRKVVRFLESENTIINKPDKK
jgi:hypothetical protein